jgi:hypothetical protein
MYEQKEMGKQLGRENFTCNSWLFDRFQIGVTTVYAKIRGEAMLGD